MNHFMRSFCKRSRTSCFGNLLVRGGVLVTPRPIVSHYKGNQVIYAIHDCSSDHTLCAIDVPPELADKLDKISRNHGMYPLVCTRQRKPVVEYRLVAMATRNEKVLDRIARDSTNLSPRFAAIDKFLDGLCPLIMWPRVFKVKSLWELMTILHDAYSKLDFADWILQDESEIPPLVLYLRSLAKELEKHGYTGTVDETDAINPHKDSYLLRYNKNDDDSGDYLVVMGDFGVTWEPAKVHTTEKLGEITGCDPTGDALTLIGIFEAYKE